MKIDKEKSWHRDIKILNKVIFICTRISDSLLKFMRQIIALLYFFLILQKWTQSYSKTNPPPSSNSRASASSPTKASSPKTTKTGTPPSMTYSSTSKIWMMTIARDLRKEKSTEANSAFTNPCTRKWPQRSTTCFTRISTTRRKWYLAQCPSDTVF